MTGELRPMGDTRNLREKRHQLIRQARGITEAARAANRALSADEVKQYDACMAECDQLKATIDLCEAERAGEQSYEQRDQPYGARPLFDRRPDEIAVLSTRQSLVDEA